MAHNRQKLTNSADRYEDGWKVINTSDEADVLADLIGMKKRGSKKRRKELIGKQKQDKRAN